MVVEVVDRVLVVGARGGRAVRRRIAEPHGVVPDDFGGAPLVLNVHDALHLAQVHHVPGGRRRNDDEVSEDLDAQIQREL